MKEVVHIHRSDSVFTPVSDVYRTFKVRQGRNVIHRYLAVPAMLRSMAIPKHANIMEIGCGPGLAFETIMRICRPVRLVGVDIEKELLEQAGRLTSKRSIEVELYQQDVRDLSFRDESFDVVIDFGTCYHIRKRPLALMEISRVLRPGGKFVYESRLNQLISHPLRFAGAQIPWHLAPRLQIARQMLMWSSRVKR